MLELDCFEPRARCVVSPHADPDTMAVAH
jgi:hypothetical protein